jgi:hypothetical protein
MIALIVSYFLIAYLLVPRAIFRGAGIFLPLRVQRTRTEEVTFALKISLIPLTIGIGAALTLHGWPSINIVDDCKEVFAASYSEAAFNRAPEKFWGSMWSVMLGQAEFLFERYYPLVLFEAILFVGLVRQYGNWRAKSRRYEWFVQKILLRGVNEWYLLLTVANFPSHPVRKVVADVLTSEDHLYEGDVADYFTDNDGGLSGLSLINSRRFDRPGYLRAKEREITTDATTEAKTFWKDLPGQALYIPREKILSINLRYLVEPIEDAENATKELRNSGIELKVEIDVDQLDSESQTKEPLRDTVVASTADERARKPS